MFVVVVCFVFFLIIFFFFYGWLSVTWFYLFIIYDFIKAMAEILLSGYFLVIKEEELYKLLLTIQEL